MNDFKLTPQLKLLFWLISHTTINNDKKPISNKELANIFFKSNPGIEINNINFLIGFNLSLIYGQDLIKYNVPGGVGYNVSTLKNPDKEIIIKSYENVYTLDYLKRNKSEFVGSQETYLTLCKVFKGNLNNLKPSQFNKINSLSNELILFCLNKGIPKRYLKYFLFYAMSFINNENIGQLLRYTKSKFKKNKVCANCGASENLTIHHIKPVSKAPYLKYNTNNFIVLCNECHRNHHQKQNLLCGGGK